MKNQSGQIMIIAIILLGVFTTIGLSVATQVVFEHKKTALQEKTRAAYYAAESGIEQALQKIYQGSALDSEITVGKATVLLSKEDVGNSKTFKVPYIINPGESFALSLTGYEGTNIQICWDKSAAFLAVFLYADNLNARKIKTFGLNQPPSAAGEKIGGVGNDLLTGNTATTCGSATDFTSGYEYTFVFNDLLPTLQLPFAREDYLVVIPMFKAVYLYFNSPENITIPLQGIIVKAKATIPEQGNSVIRTVSYFKSKDVWPDQQLLFSIYGANPNALKGIINYGAGKNW